MKRYLYLFISVAVVTFSAGLSAFEDLTVAQKLVYDTAHLANTQKDDRLEYSMKYYSTEPVTDLGLVTLDIHAVNDEERRDVNVTFLEGANRLPLPSFDNYRGNPIIIATLEFFAQKLSSNTGGGTLYFRNRIRDALANPELKITKNKLANPDQYKTSFTMTPFKQDPFLGEQAIYRDITVKLVLSDEVPGGLSSATLTSGSDSSGVYSYSLEFTGLQNVK